MNALDTSKVFLDVATDVLWSGYRMRFRAGGSSMWPTIRPGEAITVEPATATEVKSKDIVLYRTGRGVIGHRVVRIANQDGEFVLLARGDADQGASEPVAAKQLLGKVVAVERYGCCIDLTSRKEKMKHSIRVGASQCKRRILLIAKRAKLKFSLRASGRDSRPQSRRGAGKAFCRKEVGSGGAGRAQHRSSNWKRRDGSRFSCVRCCVPRS